MAQGTELGAFLAQARGARTRLSVTRNGGPEQQLLGRYESGERLPSVETLQWLCTEYHVNFEEAVRILERDRITRQLRRVA